MGESNCNWQEDEKIQLCDSWARVTVCPITGKSISLSKLWERVFADYVENWCGPPTNRSPSALQSQFRHLKKMLKDWHNAQLQSRNNIASGHNMMDQVFFLLYIINCNIIVIYVKFIPNKYLNYIGRFLLIYSPSLDESSTIYLHETSSQGI